MLSMVGDNWNSESLDTAERWSIVFPEFVTLMLSDLFWPRRIFPKLIADLLSANIEAIPVPDALI